VDVIKKIILLSLTNYKAPMQVKISNNSSRISHFGAIFVIVFSLFLTGSDAHAGIFGVIAGRVAEHQIEHAVERRLDSHAFAPASANVSALPASYAQGGTKTAAGTGFSACPQLFVNGAPPKVSQASPGVRRELCFNTFAVLHSGQSKTPLYSAERLNQALLEQAKGEERTDKFYEEARLPYAERSHLADYKTTLMIDGIGHHFDRGHQSPAGDMPDESAMAQSFSLANMVPQAPVNNRKSWSGIEKSTRKYVMRAAGDVYVITGPVFSDPVRMLGPGQVWVPKYLFKLVYDATTNRAWAYWLANEDEARVEKPITYAELVQRTGIQFLPGVSPIN
jgi:endonuclease G